MSTHVHVHHLTKEHTFVIEFLLTRRITLVHASPLIQEPTHALVHPRIRTLTQEPVSQHTLEHIRAHALLRTLGRMLVIVSQHIPAIA